jgi:aryl-alcohol dehydrogenase-like predicted oxidoreductase
VHEVKDHSSGALDRQWPESAALLGPWLRLYQVHSATPDSGVLDDRAVHRRLADLGLPVGLSLSGPHQADTLRRALGVEVDGRPLFAAVQATWNLLEPSAAPALAEAKAAGWTVVVKEALANGRLASGPEAGALGERPDAVALACALAQPWADVVLSGAASVDQLVANVGAREFVGSVDPDRYAHLVSDPARYWSSRAAMPWT